MYIPASYREDRRARIFDLIEANSFGALIAKADDGTLEIAHVPFLVDRDRGELGGLRTHVAKANPVWKLADGAEVTVVFSGAHGYVSPRWYESPSAQVPTWNYEVVHATGVARVMTSDEELLRQVDELSAKHERGASEPWSTKLLDPKKRESLLAAIVGLEISITRLDGKRKLSQNKSLEDVNRVIRALEARGSDDDRVMARAMRELHALPSGRWKV